MTGRERVCAFSGCYGNGCRLERPVEKTRSHVREPSLSGRTFNAGNGQLGPGPESPVFAPKCWESSDKLLVVHLCENNFEHEK